MMGEHERGPTSDRQTPADSTRILPGDESVGWGGRAVPLADGPRRAAARAQELAVQTVVAVTTARDVLDGTEAVPHELTAARAGLGDAVDALAARLRRDGAPPERMLVLVKDAARAATPPGADPPAARALMAHAVRRGIEAYFAA